MEKPTILIIDDDLLVLESIYACLENFCTISSTQNPNEAIEWLNKWTFDLMITDYMMPNHKGTDLITKALQINPMMESIVVTGYANKDSAIDALQNGAFDYIEKPLDPDILVSSVKRAWHMVRQKKDNSFLNTQIKIYTQQLEKQNQDLKNRNIELTNLKAALQQNKTDLELKVKELKETQDQVRSTSIKIGMAEIATNILHNVGNILNSINVSTNLLKELNTHSKTEILYQVIDLIQENKEKLEYFFTQDKKGTLIPELLNELKVAMQDEKKSITKELSRLHMNIDYIKNIITLQQNYATQPAFKEKCSVKNIIGDSLKLIETELVDSYIELKQHIDNDVEISISRHKLIQVLINLLRNARDSVLAYCESKPIIVIQIDKNPIRVSISDNGAGISKEHLNKIFSHGFTTKTNGHGFGLHSCAIAVEEMGGTISVKSDGLNKGATFIIELPE